MRTSLPPVTVVVPARDEEATVGTIVAGLVARGDVEVVVVDDGSGDATAREAAAAGARVVPASGGPGKGQALWTGVGAATGDVVVGCDADLVDFDPTWVDRLVTALLADPGLVLVKAAYRRAGQGGRVTELTARPALELLHPAVARLRQPLGGEFAGWKWALEKVPFVHGYGVDLGLVLDLAAAHGADSIGEADLGVRRHRHRPLGELRGTAREVLAVALHRAGVPGITVGEQPPLSEW